MAAPRVHSKAVPVFMVGECGFSPDILTYHLGRSMTVDIIPLPSIVHGFDNLVAYQQGILMLPLSDRASLTNFAECFQAAIRKMNLSAIKIIIFSTKQEILSSRTLSQFTFVRILSPQMGAKRVSAVLARDYRDLEAKAEQRGKPKPERASTEILVIRGTREESSMNWIQSKRDEKKGPAYVPQMENIPISQDSAFDTCIGPGVPSYIYSMDMSWRVRGYFSDFDKQSAYVTFHTTTENGARRLQEEKKKNSVFLSSSSSPSARILCSLTFVGQKGTDFTFLTPKTVHEVQRRVPQRLQVSDQDPVLIQFFDPVQNSDIALTVHDLSPSGLGVKIDKDLVKNFKIGDTLTNVTLIFYQRIVKIPQVDVRHCSRADKNPDFKLLGLQIKGLSKADFLFIEMYVLSYSMMMPKS